MRMMMRARLKSQRITFSLAPDTPTITHPKNALDARLDAEVQRQEDAEIGMGLLMRLPDNATMGDLKALIESDQAKFVEARVSDSVPSSEGRQ
jgi:hypothetical protein